MKGAGYFNEVGKTWYQSDGSKSIYRAHDEKFSGMRFEHMRCPFCNRITSIHPLHWVNHLNKCAPKKYSLNDLLKLQHYTPEEYEKFAYKYLGRKSTYMDRG